MGSLGVSHLPIKEEAVSEGSEIPCHSDINEFHSSPPTPEVVCSTPSLTPSSEASEPEFLTPSTPEPCETSLLDTPTKLPKDSHFAQTCIPLKIQLRDSDQDPDEVTSKEKVLCDVSLDSATPPRRLSNHEPLPIPVKEEPTTQFSLSVTPANLIFSKRRARKTYDKSSDNAEAASKSISAKAPRASDGDSSAGVVASAGLSNKTGAAKPAKPLAQVLMRVLPRDVLARLTEDAGRCVAETISKPIHRCKNRALQQASKTATASKILRKIDATSSGSFADFFEKVRQILPEVCCKRGRHVGIATDALDDVELRLNKAHGNEKAEIEAEVMTWMQGLAAGRTQERETTPQPRAADNRCPPFGAEKPVVNSPTLPVRRSARLAAIEASASLHNRYVVSSFQSFHPPGSRIAKLSVSAFIREKLKRPLLKSERESGYLYVFWRRGDFGLIKIGYTTRTTDERLEEWQKQCGGETEDCSTKDESSQIYVPNVRRLEALVHAELKDYRKKQLRCRGCRKGHNEWFDVDIALVRKVVDKWTNWLLVKHRYEDCVGGKLLALDDEGLEELCTPAQLEPSPSLSVAGSGRRRSSGRARTRSSIMSRLGDNPWAMLQGRTHNWTSGPLDRGSMYRYNTLGKPLELLDASFVHRQLTNQDRVRLPTQRSYALRGGGFA